MSTTATITGLSALSSVATDDVLAIVDVSDTTQAPSGSTKKVTVATLLTGYLTSATAASTYLPLAGGTLTGGLTISSGGIAVTGTTNLNSGLNVTGSTGFTGTVTVSQTLGVTGNATFAGALAHTGTTAGFFNKSAVTRPTVHSNIAGNDALALALFNALSDVVGGLGLVHDGGPV